MKKYLTGLVMVACALAAHAAGLESLASFVKNAASGRAEFTQVVTSPAREGRPARARNSSGTFEFQRPGHFRFDYAKPFSQTIVADGKTLWLYDADLNQVTVRAQAGALGATPAALIAAAPDLGSFIISRTRSGCPCPPTRASAQSARPSICRLPVITTQSATKIAASNGAGTSDKAFVTMNNKRPINKPTKGNAKTERAMSS